ncbi:DUF1648 domain-containing protein [Sanguibacter suaedae]|uniref:DUF1648 domain-containing protein n=1 Tax=Sanguibacter suaedae TaxID=2795737 RepID=A0A934M766_9MICO|nr:DUF1648 domain-containing protein [Sanguibacter suaedae]MBI9115047.1 DUF1648 domain-containing protein [Sanguibacter suaedae]
MTSPTPRPARRRGPREHALSTTLLTLVAPVLVLAVGVAVALSWRDALPDPVAVHWGADGADGFAPLTSFVAVLAGSAVPLHVGAWLLALLRGQAASTRRAATGMSTWFAAFLVAVMLGSLAGQRGLTSPDDAPDVGGTIALALALATGAAIVSALLVPRDRPLPATAAVPTEAARLAMGPDERVAWFRTVTARGGITVGATAVLGTAVLAVLSRSPWLLTVPAALVVLFLAMFRWDVRVDTDGLSVRSVLGLPRTVVPLSEVEQASVTHVDPLRDFGGWGWRTGTDGAVGIVLGKGEALQVEQTGGRVLVVTTPDAASAAALLNSLASRGRGTPDDG